MLGSEIHNLVVVKLEEYSPFRTDNDNKLLAGGDYMDEVKPIYSYVSQTLPEAANEILRSVSLNKLSFIDYTQSAVAIPDSIDNRTGMINLPSDFLRLHTLKMSDWVRPIHKLFDMSSPEYKAQLYEWTRGTRTKPIGVIESGGISYFSVEASDTHSVERFLYIPVFSNEIDYDLGVAELIALQCARKIYEIFSNNEQVTMLTNEINSVMENMHL